MRHEEKYSINYSDYLILKSKLSTLFKSDKYTDAHGEYRVRSIYFDNQYDKILMEKVNGYRKKEKFRLRMYNSDTSVIKLEKKIKIDNVCEKTSANLTLDQAKKILNSDINWMSRSDDDLISEFYSRIRAYSLEPKTVVEYKRIPFEFRPGNTRITVDTEIRTGLRSIDFFNNNIFLVPTADEYGVLEVKYDEFLPEIVRDAVGLVGRRRSAYSKYAIGRRFE